MGTAQMYIDIGKLLKELLDPGEPEKEREDIRARGLGVTNSLYIVCIYNGVGNFSEIVRGQLTSDLKIRVKVILTFFFFFFGFSDLFEAVFRTTG